MIRKEGDLTVYGTVAYCPQNPWYTHLWFLHRTQTYLIFRILSATVRDNILFSHEYDEVYYNLVIEGALVASTSCFTCPNCIFSLCSCT